MAKRCTGCGRLDTQPFGLNSKGEPYLACCPDNSYKEVTAVEWLYEMLRDNYKEVFNGNVFEQAKQMEKEQINKACYDGYYKEDEKYTYEYYNETYSK